MLDHYWTQFIANKEWQWVFSGVGVLFLGGIATFVKFLIGREGNGVSLNNKAGASPQNFQAGRDLNVTVGEKAGDTKSPRQRFIHELMTFCAESKAATAKLFLARLGDSTPESQRVAFHTALIECERHDASKHQIQLQAIDIFPNSDVPIELFEFLRRTSLTRKSIPMAEKSYFERAFAADQGWVDAQERRLISVAARAAGYDLERGEIPFLIGYHPSFVGEEEDEEADGQPPSTKIMYEYALAEVKKEWEAAGLKWDPSKLPRQEPTRQKKDSEPAAIPRRNSEPHISDGRQRSGIPKEERHWLWLAGYDSRPALIFADGVSGQVSVLVTTQLKNPVKAFAIFETGRHPIDIISPRVAAKTSQFLRTRFSSEFECEEVSQEELRLSLTDDFAEYGYELAALSIHVRLAA